MFFVIKVQQGNKHYHPFLQIFQHQILYFSTMYPNILLTGSANLLIGKAQPTDIANTIASGVTEPWKFEIAYPASGETANLTYSPQDTTQPTNTGTQTSQ